MLNNVHLYCERSGTILKILKLYSKLVCALKNKTLRRAGIWIQEHAAPEYMSRFYIEEQEM